RTRLRLRSWLLLLQVQVSNCLWLRRCELQTQLADAVARPRFQSGLPPCNEARCITASFLTQRFAHVEWFEIFCFHNLSIFAPLGRLDGRSVGTITRGSGSARAACSRSSAFASNLI